MSLIISLGYKAITASGTPERLITAAALASASGTNDRTVTSGAVKSLNANGGLMYIGLASMDKTAGTNVLWTLMPGESFSLTDMIALADIDPTILYYDGDTSGEKLVGLLYIR